MESLLSPPKGVEINITILYQPLDEVGFRTETKQVYINCWLDTHFEVVDYPDGTLAALWYWPANDFSLVIPARNLGLSQYGKSG